MTPTAISALRSWARRLRRDAVVLWLAARDDRVPWYAKALAGLVAAYALSPIDLIPDFIPVLGYLDDLILLPLGIAAAVRMIPPEVLSDLQRQATALMGRPRSRAGAVAIVLVWLATTAGLAAWLWPRS
jgi:uncharacterized membrane protein YkvA (DUF1232 family)